MMDDIFETVLAFLIFVIAPLFVDPIHLASIPSSDNLINDEIGLLTINQRLTLTEKLTTLRNKNGIKIFLLIKKDVAPENIDEYSLRAMEEWKLNDDSNSILFAINAKDISFYIRTNKSIRTLLSDKEVKQLWLEHLDPYWKKRMWAEGVVSTTDALIDVADLQDTSPPSQFFNYEVSRKQWLTLLLIVLALIYIAYRVMNRGKIEN